MRADPAPLRFTKTEQRELDKHLQAFEAQLTEAMPEHAYGPVAFECGVKWASFKTAVLLGGPEDVIDEFRVALGVWLLGLDLEIGQVVVDVPQFWKLQ
jgi:hypothetical protein